MIERLAALPVWLVLLAMEEDARAFDRRLGFERFDHVLARFDPRRVNDPL